MKERFYFKDQQGEKLIIVGSSGSGKTLFLSLLKQLSKFRNLQIVEDLWSLPVHEKRRALVNNDIVTTKKTDELILLKRDLYLLIDLDQIFKKNIDFTERRNTLTIIATEIQYKIPRLSINERKICTCDVYSLLREHGCKCGAIITPYKGKLNYE